VEVAQEVPAAERSGHERDLVWSAASSQVRVCVCVCVRACARVCVCVFACVFAWRLLIGG